MEGGRDGRRKEGREGGMGGIEGWKEGGKDGRRKVGREGGGRDGGGRLVMYIVLT